MSSGAQPLQDPAEELLREDNFIRQDPPTTQPAPVNLASHPQNGTASNVAQDTNVPPAAQPGQQKRKGRDNSDSEGNTTGDDSPARKRTKPVPAEEPTANESDPARLSPSATISDDGSAPRRKSPFAPIPNTTTAPKHATMDSGSSQRTATGSTSASGPPAAGNGQSPQNNAPPDGNGRSPSTIQLDLNPLVNAMRAEFGSMHTELTTLGHAMVGIGNTMKVMADQQASVLRDMKTVQEKQADALAAMAGSRKAAPSTSRPGRRTNAEDEMDIDDGELADDEEAAIPIPSRKGKKPKLQGPPVEQDPQRKKFLKAVRTLAKTLMKGTGEDDSDSTRLPTKEELRDFNPSFGRCCTADNFRPDLVGMPHTPWNLSVAEVFAEEFIKQKVHPCRDEVAIKKNFLRHLGYLRSRYILRTKPQEVRTEARKKHNREQRRRHLFFRRCEACASHPSAKKHLRMLQLLGADAMSSDESSTENGDAVYLVLKRSWRSPILDAWLRAFDCLYRRMRRHPLGGTTQGAQVHARKLCQKVDDRRDPKSGLPVNAYSAKWLATLTQYDRARLEIDLKPYDFTHAPEINEIATANNGTVLSGDLYV